VPHTLGPVCRRVYRGARGDPENWSHEVGTMDFEEMYRDRDSPARMSFGRGPVAGTSRGA
jgi:hypothetical protein